MNRVLLNPGFHTFFEILGIWLKIPSISDSMCKNLVFQIFDLKYRVFQPKYKVSNRNTRFLFKIVGFSFEILGISKMCDSYIV